MKNIPFALLLVYTLISLVGCGRPCGCEPGPRPDDFQFRVVDTSGRDLINNTEQFKLYYLSEQNRVDVTDFYIYHNESDTVPWPKYIGSTNQAAALSVQGIKDFYFELGYGDVDTVHIDAVHENDNNKVNSVIFNGVPAQDERGAWKLIKKTFR